MEAPSAAELEITLKAIVSVSEEMVQAARDGEWERVIELESQRHPEIECFFNAINTSASGTYENDGLRGIFERVIAMDGQISALGEVARAEVAKSLSDLRSSREAVAAYLSNTAP